MKISRLPWLRRNAKYVVNFLPGVYLRELGIDTDEVPLEILDNQELAEKGEL